MDWMTQRTRIVGGTRTAIGKRVKLLDVDNSLANIHGTYQSGHWFMALQGQIGLILLKKSIMS